MSAAGDTADDNDDEVTKHTRPEWGFPNRKLQRLKTESIS